ncbi:RNA-directed DNA polymerase [Arcobacter sp. YIC-464]|uniref:RNA-directed DNA polymerase n=1 Tax=Arcobacter sp. YIC-464 TaxID=3376631 RepID=UPI003C271656
MLKLIINFIINLFKKSENNITQSKEINTSIESKNILSLNHTQAKEFFLKDESYINVDLPTYITFEELLKEIDRTIGARDFNAIQKLFPEEEQNNKNNKKYDPKNFENVNYTLLYNKNSKYDWRPYELINPILYVVLAKEITKEENWKEIKEKLFEFHTKNSSIECMGMPVQSSGSKSDKAEQVITWWEKVEQKSLEFSLDYTYVCHTDITDCYGSIYTHSIPWALHTKEVAKENNRNSLIGNLIDTIIRRMRHGQTNGIPQGSILMDFIAEIVLGYADSELSEKIVDIPQNDYHILRYRDDYRIFTNNPQVADIIVKNLTEVLIDLGLKLHANKTLSHSNIIQGSIKEDKIHWLEQTQYQTSIQKKLLHLHSYSLKHPNSGTIVKELQKLLSEIRKNKDTTKYENLTVLISIITDIAFLNSKTYPVSIAIISTLLKRIDSEEVLKTTVSKIIKKFSNIPNTNYLEIWLQRMLVNQTSSNIEFNEKICKLIDNQEISLWNNDWVTDDIKNIFDKKSIVNEEIKSSLDLEIAEDEVKLFGTISS